MTQNTLRSFTVVKAKSGKYFRITYKYDNESMSFYYGGKYSRTYMWLTLDAANNFVEYLKGLDARIAAMPCANVVIVGEL
jgi:hypothetical protein